MFHRTNSLIDIIILDHTLVENALKQSSFSFYAFNVTTNEFLLINHTESN